MELRSYEVSQIVMYVDFVESRRIGGILWTIANISKLIDSSGKPHRILRNKSSNLRVIPAGAIVHQAGQRIAFAAGIVVAGFFAAAAVAESVVGELIDKVALIVGERSGAAQIIRRKVDRGAFLLDRAGLANLVVDAGAIQLINCGAVVVDVFH